jgi:hypothetical protein
MFTTMNFQFAGLCAPKLSCLLYASFAFGTLESLWMKMLEYPLSAIFFVQEFCDWKFHDQSLSCHGTSFTHEPKILDKYLLSKEDYELYSGRSFEEDFSEKRKREPIN